MKNDEILKLIPNPRQQTDYFFESRRCFSADRYQDFCLYKYSKEVYDNPIKCRKLAEQNDPYAQYQYGLLCQKGNDPHVPQDSELAWIYIIKAAEQHLSDAMECIAKAESIPDTPNAQTVLAECCLFGVGVEKNYDKALSLLQKFSNEPYCFARAQNILGECYEEEKKYEQALEYYLRAYNQGYSDAKFYLASLIYRNQSAEEIEIKRALTLLHESADIDNNKMAQHFLGYLYENGDDYHQKDEYKAYKYYKKSAEQNLTSAQIDLGNCYENGIGIRLDIDKAKIWYQKAADKDNTIAMCRLGYIYYFTNEYYYHAKRCYLKAAKRGDSTAQFAMGIMYIGEKNFTEGFRWIHESAEQGNYDAQCFERVSMTLEVAYGKENIIEGLIDLIVKAKESENEL